MYRYLLVIAICICMLSGCAKKEAETNAAMELYESYYTEVLNTKNYLDSSDYFSISTEMTQLSDGTYRYYVIIDNPKTEMYHCRIFAVENDIAFADNDKMMPSLGVFDTDVSLVPNQVDKSKGLMKGLVISGESSEDHIKLKFVVEWRDQSNKQVVKQYIQKELQYKK